jgi:hypothetical protein
MHTEADRAVSEDITHRSDSTAEICYGRQIPATGTFGQTPDVGGDSTQNKYGSPIGSILSEESDASLKNQMNPFSKHICPPFGNGHWKERIHKYDCISCASLVQGKWSLQHHEFEIPIL